MQGWFLRQFDVNNAFLHCELTENIYMVQPLGFKDISNPDHVCRLCKAIYGLKKAPWALYSTLKHALIELGFQNSKADSSLFISFGAVSLHIIFWSMWMTFNYRSRSRICHLFFNHFNLGSIGASQKDWEIEPSVILFYNTSRTIWNAHQEWSIYSSLLLMVIVTKTWPLLVVVSSLVITAPPSNFWLFWAFQFF